MVYFKRVVVKNLRTGEEMECPSRYPGVYIMKARIGDTVKIILDILGPGEEDFISLRIRYLGKEYNEALRDKSQSHIEKTFTISELPCAIDIMVGHYYPTPDDVLHVEDERIIEFRQAQKPLPILHLDIPDSWEPSCDRFPCSISFTGKVYDATGQHKYAYCNITATIEDLDTGELSTVQTTTDTNGNFRITFNVRRPGKKKIEVVAHTPDGRAEAEAIVNVIGPELRIAQISADKTTITEGESVKVTATITNSGNADGTCVAELLIDGLLVTDKKLTVPAGSSVKVSFKVEDLQEGSHTVCVRI